MCSGLALLKATSVSFAWSVSVIQKCMNNSLDLFLNEVINGITPIRVKAKLSLHQLDKSSFPEVEIVTPKFISCPCLYVKNDVFGIQDVSFNAE